MTKKPWVPVLVGLVVALLAGPGRGVVGAAEPRLTTESIMIPAAAFTPSAETYVYLNNGWGIEADPGTFTAPLHFAAPVVSIQKMTIYAYDNRGPGGQFSDVCVFLGRSAPANKVIITQGQVCTFGSSDTDPQIFSTTAISPRRVNTAIHGSYLYVLIPDGETRFYGVRITYSY